MKLKKTARKCKNNYCDRPAIGNSTYARCRECYVEDINMNVQRLCLGQEDCDFDCKCRWIHGRKKREEYFKHQKLLVSQCHMCGCRIRFEVLDVLFGGDCSSNSCTRYDAGSKYGAHLCWDCDQNDQQKKDEVQEWLMTAERPKISYSGIAFRIENPDGIGPFRSLGHQDRFKDLSFACNLASNMGVPEDEGIYDGLFAFTSMEALNFYIRPELLKFWLETGFAVKELTLPKNKVRIFDDGLQLAFKPVKRGQKHPRTGERRPPA